MIRITALLFSVSVITTTACWEGPRGAEDPDRGALSAAVVEDAPACAELGEVAMIGGVAYASIQDAVDAAQPSETVEVCPGFHVESIHIHANQWIELTSWSGNAADTVLGGQGSFRILRLHEWSRATVSNLTFRGGFAWPFSDGGAILSDAYYLGIHGCRFVDNFAGYGGGAICATSDPQGATPTVVVEDCWFRDNVADYEGGAISAGTWDGLALTVSDSVFVDNTATYAGGAISIASWNTVTLSVSDSVFFDNTAGYEGGAITAAGQGPADAEIVDSLFRGNLAGYGGGAVQVGGYEPNTLDVRRTKFRENHAGNEGGAVSLGAWEEFDASFTGCSFERNSSAGSGGALALGTWEAGTLWMED